MSGLTEIRSLQKPESLDQQQTSEGKGEASQSQLQNPSTGDC